MRLLIILLLCAAPALAQPKPDPAKAALDDLLTALALAPSEDVASRLEARIGQQWLKSGGPTAALLLTHGTATLQAGDAVEAQRDFDAALALEPKLAEAFSRRAMARYQSGDVAGAYRDLEQAVSLEPRHFQAWRSLSVIAEAQENWAGALAAWKQLLQIDPKTPNAQPHLKELTRRVEGEES